MESERSTTKKSNNIMGVNNKKATIFASLAVLLFPISLLAWVSSRYYAIFPSAYFDKELPKLVRLDKNDRRAFESKIEDVYILSDDVDIKNLKIDENKVSYSNRGSKKNKDKKVMVFFPGNGWDIENKLEFMNEIVTDEENKFDDIIIINYPSYAISLDGVVKGPEDILKNLIRDGYKPENIDIVGFSIGGGVSLEVLNKFKDNGVLKDGEKFGSVLNINSFSKLSKVLPHSEVEKSKRGPLSKLSSTIFKGFNMDAAKILKDKNLPVSNKVVISAKGDKMIDKYASMSKAATYEKDILVIKNIEPSSDPHNEIKTEQIVDVLNRLKQRRE